MTSRPADAADAFTLDLGTAQTGARLHRAADPQAPAVLIAPALGVPARSYRRLAEALVAQDMHALRVDFRGLDTSSVRAHRDCDWSYLDLVDGELAALYRLARERLPDAPIVWLGHSLGGQAALLHQARHPGQPAVAVALVASGSPWHRAFGWRAPLLRAFGRLTRWMCDRFGVFRGDWVGFGDAQGATLMREWSTFLLTGALPPLGREGWAPMEALSRVRTPIYALSMRHDSYAPSAATRHLAGLTAAPLRFERLERLDGHGVPGHFKWMKHPQTVAKRLAAFVRQLPAPSPPASLSSRSGS